MKSMLQHNQNASSVNRLYVYHHYSIAGLGASDFSTVVQYNHVRCAIT